MDYLLCASLENMKIVPSHVVVQYVTFFTKYNTSEKKHKRTQRKKSGWSSKHSSSSITVPYMEPHTTCAILHIPDPPTLLLGAIQQSLQQPPNLHALSLISVR